MRTHGRPDCLGSQKKSTQPKTNRRSQAEPNRTEPINAVAPDRADSQPVPVSPGDGGTPLWSWHDVINASRSVTTDVGSVSSADLGRNSQGLRKVRPGPGSSPSSPPRQDEDSYLGSYLEFLLCFIPEFLSGILLMPRRNSYWPLECSPSSSALLRSQAGRKPSADIVPRKRGAGGRGGIKG